MLSSKKTGLVAKIIKDIPGLACAYIHGAAQTEYFRPESHIDIALIFFPENDKDFSPLDAFDYSEAIELATCHPADISTLSSYNVVFAKEVVSKGRLIVCNDDRFCHAFNTYTRSMYAELNRNCKEAVEEYTTA